MTKEKQMMAVLITEDKVAKIFAEVFADMACNNPAKALLFDEFAEFSHRAIKKLFHYKEEK